MSRIANWKKRLGAKREQLRLRYMPQFASWLADLATYRARQSIQAAEPLTVLIDNSVLGHAITHETGWVSTGEVLWGGKHPIDTGYMARLPVHPVDAEGREYEELKYLTGIAHLARQQRVVLRTSAELRYEVFRQPIGRYRGYGYFDYSLLHGVPIESVDGWVGPTIGPKWMELPSPAEQQRKRLDQRGDELYRALLGILGSKNSQDAWHIRTAEKHGLYCFLTMDFKLRRRVQQLAAKEPLASLRTRILTPKELGEELGILPLPPHLFSYTAADGFVRTDICMPNGRRRPLARYQRGSKN